MTTTARTHARNESHWYRCDGTPCYELPKKDGSGMKVPTLADAKKLNLLPSVTTVLKTLARPALIDWMIEMACLAVLTAPRGKDEGIDAFVHRVLHEEEQQHEERDAAAKRGTQLHQALQDLAFGVECASADWVLPAWNAIQERVSGWIARKPEIILCGEGYAGKTDLLVLCPEVDWLFDYKSTAVLPEKGSWPEHRLQLAAYAKARTFSNGGKPIKTANVYISRDEPGKFVLYENPPWEPDYLEGFKPILQHWMWAHSYRCAQ